MVSLSASALMAQTQPLFFDGGLGSQLETLHPESAHHKLWSTLTLLERPLVITDIHHRYLCAGSDMIGTCSYQALVRGLLEHGQEFGLVTVEDCRGVFRQSVVCAVEAVERWLQANPVSLRLRPLVAASIGPYGAYLAQGEEYTGAYGGITMAELKEFHRVRLEVFLQHPQVDLLAFETFPSMAELRAVMELLEELCAASKSTKPFYVSLNFRNASQMCDGTPVAEAVLYLQAAPPGLVAVGANCLSLSLVPEVIQNLSQLVGGVFPLVVYPNSGEIYDGTTKEWHPPKDPLCRLTHEGVARWFAAGVRILGGCCRTGPSDIQFMRRGFESEALPPSSQS